MNQEINQTTPPPQEQTGFSTNELLAQIAGFFRAPVFEDDTEKTRIAGVLNPILLSLFAGISFIPISALIENPTTALRSVLIGVIVLVPITVSLIAVRRGFVRRTASIFVTVLFLMLVVFSGLFGRSQYNPIFPGLMTVIFLAYTLLGTRTGVVIGILSVADIFALQIIEQFAALPVVLEATESTYFQSIMLSMILMVFYVFFGTRTYGRAFQQVAETEISLRDTNIELEEIRAYLEEEVAENTQQLERRSRYLEAGAKVANASISTQNLQEMLDVVAREVSAQFGFYHVGIFMVDEQKEWAALRAASSEGGQQMIARNHRLEVGRQGIVGFVTSLGQGRISQDTGDDRVHTPTVELPNTRSEMALPLISRGEVIGAIDIQDTKPEAFTEDDITVLQTMADQVALAIENIRLFEQTQETLEEVQRLYGEFSQKAWQEAYQKSQLTSYRYFSGAVIEIDEDTALEMTENTVSIPVEVRGVNLGAIEISKGEDEGNWTEDEIKLLRSLSEQLGIALDSARLFNESQLRATTEHTISQINSQLWETMDINAILRSTADNLRQTLALPELTIRMASPETEADASTNGNLDNEEVEVND